MKPINPIQRRPPPRRPLQHRQKPLHHLPLPSYLRILATRRLAKATRQYK